MMLITDLAKELKKNNGKISHLFVEDILNHKDTKVSHAQLTPNTRVCVITTVYGHDLVGYAQVLDETNDVELIGQKVAYDNAKEQLWAVLGSIAKVILRINMTQIKVNDTVYGFWNEEQPQTICDDTISSILETSEGFTYTLQSGLELRNPKAFYVTKEALVADWLEANGITFELQAS